MLAREIGRDLRLMVRRPSVVSVSDSIAANLVTANGPYDPDLTPYMREPADALASRRYKTVCFVGPARTGKTVTLIDGWITRVVVDDPGDMLVVQASQDLSRDYSKFRASRFIEASEAVKERQSPRRQDDNTYDKVFRSGMRVSFGWPSGAQLSSRDFRYVAITEYDSASDDIDGEGSLYALASKRTQTYLSAGKVLVESSVRREYRDSNWRPKMPHELPPATGITAIYNGGTMKWLHWRCEHCGKWLALDPDIHVMFRLPEIRKLVDELKAADAASWARDNASVCCDGCGAEFDEARKRELNGAAKWLASGCSFSGDEIVGTPRDAQTDSYTLSCVAAAYQSWREILEKYAVAIQDFLRSGSESEIKSTVNLDQGRAYLPMHIGERRDVHELQSRAEDWQQGTVPQGVRFLTAQVDVQAGQRRGFVVQVIGWGANREHWIIDRYALKSSERSGPDGGFLPIDPAGYAEDWRRLIEKCIERRYPVADGSGRTMPVRLTLCDSGGEDGVTTRAYEFHRYLVAQGNGHRFRLVKGVATPRAPRVKQDYPDTRKRSDRKSGSAGDVPVLFLNTNEIKDTIAADLSRSEPGPGYWHFPSWLPTSFYDELTAESRGAKGWIASGKKNETLDLCVYGEAAFIWCGGDKIKWNAPPSWAADWDANPDVIADDASPAVPRVRKLRRVASSYLGR